MDFFLSKLRFVVAAALLASSGCVSPHGAHCADRADEVGRKKARVPAQFEVRHDEERGVTREVLVPAGPLAHPRGAPVVILHEFPALSDEVLDLAARVAEKGYSVYVPVLLNRAYSDPASRVTLASTFLRVHFGREWRAADAAAERPVVDWVADFCNDRVAQEHPGQRIGVIGMCLSGIFPVALLPKVPQLYAPVVAHPSMPFHVFKRAAERDKAATGLTKLATAQALDRVQRQDLQILGVRFECDHFATAERFATLRSEFGDHFCPLTLAFADYHGRDGLDPDAHSVLGGCYLNPAGHPAASTKGAFEEVLTFLDAKLRHPTPRRYESAEGQKRASGQPDSARLL